MIFGYLYLTVLTFVFGACIGSLLNVCIYRIPRDESIVKPRSHCPHCNTMIAWYDNIPIASWLVLRARCRHCKQPISPRYVLVEALVGVLFVFVWLVYGLSWLTPVYWLLVSGLVIATFVDFEHMIIPDRISLGGIAVGLVLSALFPSMHLAHAVRMPLDHVYSLGYSALGAVCGAGSLWLVGEIGRLIFRKDAMGLGDVKLLGAIGAFLGWQAVVFTVVFSSLLGTIAGVGLIVAGRRDWQGRIPYGPYLAAAAVVWVLAGYGWWAAYVQWITSGR